ncbi:hypothetical protein [Bacillus sp. RC252]
MKVARTVLSGGKDGDNFKVLPIATIEREISMITLEIKYKKAIIFISPFG